MMIDKKGKVEVKYQSKFTIFTNRALSVIGSIAKPIIAIFMILLGLYVVGYIVVIFVLFFLLLFLYKKIKNII